MILSTGKRNIAMLGLSFKPATDDLRESPHVHVVKRLLERGARFRIGMQCSLGRLIGPNGQYIEEVIPHIGSLLCSSLEEALRGAELVIVGTRSADCETLRRTLRADQAVIDLVNLRREIVDSKCPPPTRDLLVKRISA